MAKNKHIEYLRKRSQRYAKTAKNGNRWDHQRGIKVYHVYDEPCDKSWWDDVAFMMGSQQVVVWYVHPRFRYQDQVNDLAREQLESERPPRADDWFLGGTKNYRYVGKNKKRKRVVSITCPEMPVQTKEYYDRLFALEKQMYRTSDVEVGCEFKVKQYSYCRGVEICIPVEVCNEDDLEKLVQMVRGYLTEPGSFERTWKGYKYTRDDWNKDFPEEV